MPHFEKIHKTHKCDVICEQPVVKTDTKIMYLAMWNSRESSTGRTRVVERRPPTSPGPAMFSRDRDLIKWRSLVSDIFRWLEEMLRPFPDDNTLTLE